MWINELELELDDNEDVLSVRVVYPQGVSINCNCSLSLTMTMCFSLPFPSFFLFHSVTQCLFTLTHSFFLLIWQLLNNEIYSPQSEHTLRELLHDRILREVSRVSSLILRAKPWLAEKVLRHGNRFVARVRRRYFSEGEKRRPEMRLLFAGYLWQEVT